MKWICALVVFAACGGSQKEVAMQGSDLDLARVAGDWEGEYKGNESGRTGPVNLSLHVGSHTAEGEILMGGKTPLKIAFVKIKEREVKGTIAPYTDPNCACQVETEFVGTYAEDTIDGTFTTKVSTTGQVQTGSWSVRRKR